MPSGRCTTGPSKLAAPYKGETSMISMTLGWRPDGNLTSRAAGLLALVATLAVGLVAAASTLWFQQVSANALAARGQLAVAAVQLAEHDGLEWRAISGLVPLSELGPKLAELRVETKESFAHAEKLGAPPSTVIELRQLYDRYADAVDQELSLLAEGERDEAIDYAQAVVDPAFEATNAALDSAQEDVAEEAKHALWVSRGGAIGTVVLALAVVAFVERRRQLVHPQTERRSEARYRALVDQSNDLVLVLGPKQEVWYASPAAQRALGLSDPTVSLLDLVHPDDRAVAAPLFEGRVADGRENRAVRQLRLRHVTLGWRICEVTINDLRSDEAVGGIVVTARDVTEQHELLRQVEHQALHDALTGLPNRILFHDRVQHAIARVDRSGEQLFVLYLDLDDFKTVNDTLGHEVGDQLLRHVAGRVSATIRTADTLSRLGGDEFAVLLEDADLPQATLVANRIQDALAEEVTLGGSSFHITASIGLAAYQGPWPAPTVSELLRAADIAMYRSKRAGKGRSTLYAPAMQEELQRRTDLERELQHALDRNEIEVVYQPIVRLATGDIVGAEALMRWHNGTYGQVSPAEFIPLAEQSGLIVPLGRYVLRQACARAASWNASRADGGQISVAVNISPRQLQDPDLVGDVSQALRDSGLPARLLTIEVTETQLLQENCAAVLSQIRQLGVRVALDDFGTGYASLSHLNSLSVDQLKIDLTFVHGLTSGGARGQLTASVLALAEGLGLDVVAEGIETEDQLERLRELGAQAGQGFLFSHPRSDPEMQPQSVQAPSQAATG
jgi:diguanylate cyclase (GGDEF)-like protein/PAS domain S-box-containing protein